MCECVREVKYHRSDEFSSQSTHTL